MTTHEEQWDALSTEFAFVASLVAGGAAGTSVDIALYPIDTLKTRLQAKQGFRKAGGFSGIYKGIVPVALGSAPTAALFFVTYEGIKSVMQPKVPSSYHNLIHMGAASLSEMVACLIRVPVETLKQRKQALVSNQYSKSLRLLYRGYWSTVLRDMPFSLIQFPLWEYFKVLHSSNSKREILPWESAVCGAFAGGISAAVTTPLDVAKTRIMLAEERAKSSHLGIMYVLRDIYKDRGFHGLYAGIVPRVIWITVGGFVFFGSYEQIKVLIVQYTSRVPLLSKETSI